jgi:hypothetical protein
MDERQHSDVCVCARTGVVTWHDDMRMPVEFKCEYGWWWWSDQTWCCTIGFNLKQWVNITCQTWMSNMTPKHESEGKQTDVAYECTCVRSEFECSNLSLNSKLTIHMNSESAQVVHEGNPSTTSRIWI